MESGKKTYLNFSCTQTSGNEFKFISLIFILACLLACLLCYHFTAFKYSQAIIWTEFEGNLHFKEFKWYATRADTERHPHTYPTSICYAMENFMMQHLLVDLCNSEIDLFTHESELLLSLSITNQ